MTRRVNWEKPKRQAVQILKTLKIAQPPVPLEQIAQYAGVEVLYKPAEQDISGFVYRHDNEVVIGINEDHPPTRQRFTLAHELGHLLLHDKDFFIDHFEKFRNVKSSQAVDPDEIEANAFAAELLMPEEFIFRDISQLDDNLTVDAAIKQLADRYFVSEKSMRIRLNHLGLITLDN